MGKRGWGRGTLGKENEGEGLGSCHSKKVNVSLVSENGGGGRWKS